MCRKFGQENALRPPLPMAYFTWWRSAPFTRDSQHPRITLFSSKPPYISVTEKTAFLHIITVQLIILITKCKDRWCSEVFPSVSVHCKIKIRTWLFPCCISSSPCRSAHRNALFEFPSVNNIKAGPLRQLQVYTIILSSSVFSASQTALR